MRYARSYLPIGSHGITNIAQTQFYHLYGPIGVVAVMAMPLASKKLSTPRAKTNP